MAPSQDAKVEKEELEAHRHCRLKADLITVGYLFICANCHWWSQDQFIWDRNTCLDSIKPARVMFWWTMMVAVHLQQVSKQRVNGPSGLLSATNASISTHNKRLTMTDEDIWNTVMRHAKTWKLEIVPRPRQKHASIRLKTRYNVLRLHHCTFQAELSDKQKLIRAKPYWAELRDPGQGFCPWTPSIARVSSLGHATEQDEQPRRVS